MNPNSTALIVESRSEIPSKFHQNSTAGTLSQPELTEPFSKLYPNNNGSSLQENGAIAKNPAEVPNERKKTYSEPNSTLELSPKPIFC